MLQHHLLRYPENLLESGKWTVLNSLPKVDDDDERLRFPEAFEKPTRSPRRWNLRDYFDPCTEIQAFDNAENISRNLDGNADASAS